VPGFVASRKDEEFLADFLTVARKELRNEQEWQVFHLRFIDGHDYRLIAKKLAIKRGDLFHLFYRLEARIGTAFHALRPYALHPAAVYYRSERSKQTLSGKSGVEASERCMPLTMDIGAGRDKKEMLTESEFNDELKNIWGTVPSRWELVPVGPVDSYIQCGGTLLIDESNADVRGINNVVECGHSDGNGLERMLAA